MQQVIIYLHGFLSSPKSVKAQLCLDYARQHYPDVTMVAPQLPGYPKPTLDTLRQLVKQYNGHPLRFIGSSMGGYFSTWLVENFAGKAVLINPAVRPFELLKDFLGEQHNSYTNERFVLTAGHMHQLRELYCENLALPQNYRVLLQTGDEVLDYQLAAKKYQHSQLVIEQGGDHSFVDFERHLADVFDFLLGD